MTETQETVEPVIQEGDLQLITYINSDEFKVKFEKICNEMRSHHNYWGPIGKQVLSYFEDLDRQVTKSQRRLKNVFEEAKRMLLSVFYIVDVINDGSTHHEKNQYTNTAIQVIRKQIAFFEEMSTNDYVEDYFSQGRYSSLILNYELTDEIKTLKNERKAMQSEIKHLKDLHNGDDRHD